MGVCDAYNAEYSKLTRCLINFKYVNVLYYSGRINPGKVDALIGKIDEYDQIINLLKNGRITSFGERYEQLQMIHSSYEEAFLELLMALKIKA
jgi:hypothetical protein